MPKITIIKQGKKSEFIFEGTPLLSEALLAFGISQPHLCGGRGTCGKCAVTVSGQVSEENALEQAAGVRLSCQVRLLGDCEAVLNGGNEGQHVALEGEVAVSTLRPIKGRYGAAIDIGTTTLALRLYDLNLGKALSEAGGMNPQTAIAADVMGRIGAAMTGVGQQLQSMLLDALEALLHELCAKGKISFEELDVLSVTGNTTMLYLLMGKDPSKLSHAPFDADCLFGDWTELFGKRTYLARCMSAFVGGDISCAVLASGMCKGKETALLVDVGTNGEMALWHEGMLHVASTAAGPAFEGGGIHLGCGGIPGAINKVWQEGTALGITTIDNQKAVGICGSGLIDAIAALLATERIDETGYTEEELHLSDEVYLIPKDIRNVQLAKSAIAAGIKTLLHDTKASLEDIRTLYVAGGFGSRLNYKSAAAIGLFPKALLGREKICGNAALAGAGMLLLDTTLIDETEHLAKTAATTPLGGSSRFADYYMDEMMF